MKKVIIAAFGITTLILSGCLSSNSMAPETTKITTGSAKVSIQLGKIGALAKVSTIELKTLEVTLSANGEKDVERVVTVSGNSQQTVDMVFEELASLKTWTVKAKTQDVKGVTIHAGSTSFYVLPSQTASADLEMGASYSMLKAEFSDIPDSVKSVELKVNGNIQDVETVNEGFLTGQNVQLSYDYLETEKSHDIVLNVYGTMWEKDYLLYTGEVEVEAVSGEDKGYEVTLNWVGPAAPPKGKATIKVSLGRVATSSVKAKFEQNEITYEAENIEGKKK